MESSEQSGDGTQVLSITGDYNLAAATGMYQSADGGSGEDSISVQALDDETTEKQYSPLREQDRFLPIANVARIMKTSIPANGKISKEAKECVQECVSEFISFITSEASERCHQEKRKTINGEDILFAMSNLGFDNYVEPLKVYLQKYRELVMGITSSGKIQKDAFRKVINFPEVASPNLGPLLKSVKGEKTVGGGMTASDTPILEDMNEDFSTTNLISTDQPGQQGTIFTYTNQMAQPLNYQ
ncbi:nuclear transcription factor Y subunit beta-like isoform X1 [Anneissia japonica]|uniref:nuclear transcription factor Y subunit beta-like isoform X1 n=1 Tax=Anneissia japonica TaxID=1529436 RepID=UPI0014255C08|nr:nuclear transcription factor Y subunit beta-like isoform X1 [Anneissia japonica]XP_033114717.1 nuclear transcription factor Y subunit beta-like isoform X1 [Anneissia japonica]XP_033114718.1 nuclear transcription factor Y subunit beta-like isoform X1 [Anneissia japonica]